MKEYRAKKSTLVFTLGFLSVLTAVTIFGVFFAPPRWFFIVLLVAIAWEWYRHLKAPVTIRMRDDGSLEFKSLVGRRMLTPQQIRRVRRVGRYFSLEHEKGSINLYANMEDLQEFLDSLQALNPSLEVKTFSWGAKR